MTTTTRPRGYRVTETCLQMSAAARAELATVDEPEVERPVCTNMGARFVAPARGGAARARLAARRARCVRVTAVLGAVTLSALAILAGAGRF